MAVNELLQQFHEIAAAPKKQLQFYLDQGQTVIGCVPVYTPEELIHAMGFVPMGVWGADGEIKEAKQYFPAFICSIMQSILELGIAGTYAGMTALMVPSLCDSLKCLGQNWKFAVKDIPFIPMSYPQNRKGAPGQAFTRAGYERVIAELERLTGAVFKPEALTASLQIYNEHNQAMRRLSEILADYPSVTASQRQDIFKSAYFMRKEEHTIMVNQLIELLNGMPKETSDKIKVVTSGILADSPGLLKVLDEHGIQIVADDVAHESRQYRTDSPRREDPLAALVEKFTNTDHCSVLYDVDKQRVDLLVELVRQHGAKGIIQLQTKFCDPEEFDFVIIKKRCEKEDIHLIQIEVDRQMENYEQANTMIQTFKEMVQ